MKRFKKIEKMEARKYLLLFIFSYFHIFIFSSCSIESTTYEKYGVVDFSTLQRSVVVTRADVAPEDYTVRLWRKLSTGEVLTFERPMSQCTGQQSVRVSDYRLEVSSSADCPAGEWDTPWYAGRSEIFTVEEGKTTSVGNILCTQGNVKVSVECDESLFNVFDDGSLNINVAIGENSLDFAYGETRAGFVGIGGYWDQAPDQEVDMTVTFSGLIEGMPFDSIETIAVKAGDWQQFKFILEGYTKVRLIVTQSGIDPIEEGDQWF